jgi:hypothetical protein
MGKIKEVNDIVLKASEIEKMLSSLPVPNQGTIYLGLLIRAAKRNGFSRENMKNMLDHFWDMFSVDKVCN